MYPLLQLAMGKMMDQGPVLIITFQAQLVMVIRNTKGEVVEGDPVSNTHANRMAFVPCKVIEIIQSFSRHFFIIINVT